MTAADRDGTAAVAGPTVRRPPARLRNLGVLLGVSAGVLLACAGRVVRRVEVVGDSMSPALASGDRLVVVAPPGARFLPTRPGAIVAVRDPRLPARTLVKRVAAVDRHAGTLMVLGDAAAVSTDSRTFGPLGRSAVVGWPVYRYAPAHRVGPRPWPDEYHQA